MSAFLDRKAKAYFKHLDLDDDGYISLKDFVKIAERQCDAEKADAVEKEKTRELFAKVWRKYMKSAGSDDTALLTPFIFAKSIIQQKNDPDFKEAFMTMCHQLFHVLDISGDGFLQEEEFARTIHNTGMTDLYIAHRAFKLADVNQDGKLSSEEFSTALYEFLTSEDVNNRYTGLFPLLD